MRRRGGNKRSAAQRSERARTCPACKHTDGLRVTFNEDKSSTTWCRFCNFTETRGRNV